MLRYSCLQRIRRIQEQAVVLFESFPFCDALCNLTFSLIRCIKELRYELGLYRNSKLDVVVLLTKKCGEEDSVSELKNYGKLKKEETEIKK